MKREPAQNGTCFWTHGIPAYRGMAVKTSRHTLIWKELTASTFKVSGYFAEAGAFVRNVGELYRTTRCHIPEDCSLHSDRCENLRFSRYQCIFVRIRWTTVRFCSLRTMEHSFFVQGHEEPFLQYLTLTSWSVLLLEDCSSSIWCFWLETTLYAIQHRIRANRTSNRCRQEKEYVPDSSLRTTGE
jgi:hypothetical protein